MGGGERKSNEPLDVRLVDPNLKYIFQHNNSLSIVHCGGYLHSIYEKQKKEVRLQHDSNSIEITFFFKSSTHRAMR
jgi:hypothetical protein